jgi:hypothetical protein
MPICKLHPNPSSFQLPDSNPISHQDTIPFKISFKVQDPSIEI